MKKIKTKKFIFSTQAKKLPEVIPIDEEFAYILGLWNADRCSTAKGIVGLRSKDDSLLEAFRKFFKKLGLQSKERTVIGYGKTKEVYVCSMPLRRIFEWARKNRLKLFGKRELILAYVAGLFDGHMEARRHEQSEWTSYNSLTGTKKSHEYPDSYYELTITDGVPDVTMYYLPQGETEIKKVDFESGEK